MFLTLKRIVPCRTDFTSLPDVDFSVILNSFSVTLIVAVGFGGGVVPVTVRLPCMPAAAWPGSVQRYGYVPASVIVTVIVAVAPGRIVSLVVPAIEKSCGVFPSLISVNTTVPVGTESAESENAYSVMCTVTSVVVPAVFGDSTPAIENPASAVPTTATHIPSTTTKRRMLNPLDGSYRTIFDRTTT